MTDPTRLLTIPQIAEHAQVSADYVRRRMSLGDTHPERLQSIRHAGRLKARLEWVDDWIARTSTAS